jgi:alkylhydroperoxidase/carboxymuconolactone decarboxylase family protein YurZ
VLPRNIDSSSRFPSTLADAKTSAQKEGIVEAERVVLEAFGPTIKLRDEDGSLLGPFAPLMYTPENIVPYLKHAAACVGTKHLTLRERELVTLAVGSVARADYVLYAHKHIAISIGLSPEQADSAASGTTPTDLNESETLLFAMGLEMAKGYGKVSEKCWEMGKKMLGLEGMAAVAQLVGSYLHASCLVNCAKVRSPKEKGEDGT